MLEHLGQRKFHKSLAIYIYIYISLSRMSYVFQESLQVCCYGHNPPVLQEKATKFVRTRGFSKLTLLRNTGNLVNPLVWTWTWLKHFQLFYRWPRPLQDSTLVNASNLSSIMPPCCLRRTAPKLPRSWGYWIQEGTFETCTFQTCTLFSARFLALTTSRLPAMPSFPPSSLWPPHWVNGRGQSRAPRRVKQCRDVTKNKVHVWKVHVCPPLMDKVLAAYGCTDLSSTGLDSGLGIGTYTPSESWYGMDLCLAPRPPEVKDPRIGTYTFTKAGKNNKLPSVQKLLPTE